jgi:hypothetical protein
MTASSTTKTGRHDISESDVKHQKSINQSINQSIYRIILLSDVISESWRHLKGYCLPQS